MKQAPADKAEYEGALCDTQISVSHAHGTYNCVAAEEAVADESASTNARNDNVREGPSTVPTESAAVNREEEFVDLDEDDKAALIYLDTEEDMLEVLDVDAMDSPDETSPPGTDEKSYRRRNGWRTSSYTINHCRTWSATPSTLGSWNRRKE